MRMERLELSQD